MAKAKAAKAAKAAATITKSEVVLSDIAQGDIKQAEKDVAVLKGDNYDRSTFEAVVVPPDASYVEMLVDRSSIGDSSDGLLVSMNLDVSLDGGKTWGGTFDVVDDVKKTITQYPLTIGAMFGGIDAKVPLPEGISNIASRGTALPPDQGSGRLVRVALSMKVQQPVGFKLAFS
jgi:hypothetical protein